jgi:hypothetical protein
VRNRLREFSLRAHRPYIGFPLIHACRARRMTWLAVHGPRGECGDYAGGQDEQPCLDVALLRADVPVADGLQPFQYLSDDRQDALWWRHSQQIAKQLVVAFDLALTMQ